MGCAPMRRRENFIGINPKEKTSNKSNTNLKSDLRRTKTKSLKVVKIGTEIKEIREIKEPGSNEKGSQKSEEIQSKFNQCQDTKVSKDSQEENKINDKVVISETDPFKKYEKMCLLGKGNSSDVYKVTNKESGHYRAMKIIDKQHDKYTEETLHLLNKEIKMLNSLDHPNILKNFEILNTKNKIYMINQLCSSTELFEKLQKDKIFSEITTANIMKQLISAVNFCHLNGVVHRDLRLEKILIDSTNEVVNEVFNIKIINFVNSENFINKSNLKEIVGRPYYIAPEVLNANYNEKCDMWSCGVIMYTLLCGMPPFFSEDDDEVLELVKKGKYNEDPPEMKDISKEAKNLIKGLLKKDVDKRLSSEQSLNHEWFKIMSQKILEKNKISYIKIGQMVDNIINFSPKKSFQLATLGFLIFNYGRKQETNDLRKIFDEFDTDNDGRLTRNDFVLGLTKVIPIDVAKREVNRIFKAIDLDNGGYIEFQEFLMATVNTKDILSSNNLRMCFNAFDTDKSGWISIEELKQILGKKIDEKEMHLLLQNIKLTREGELNFEEFEKLMKETLMDTGNEEN